MNNPTPPPTNPTTNPPTNPALEALKAAYLQSLTEKETQAYLIAKGHLGTSFTLEKSNGYLSWLKDQGQSSG